MRRQISAISLVVCSFLLGLRALEHNPIVLNKTLVSLLRQTVTVPVTSNPCGPLEQRQFADDSSLTLTMQCTRWDFLFDRISLSEMARVTHRGCATRLPNQWSITSKDPRTRLINYYFLLSQSDESNFASLIDSCKEHLPSSTYLFYQAQSSHPSEKDSATAQLLAYKVDQEWQHPHQRALNAYYQGETYQENGQLELAAGAYTRAIESFAVSDHKNRKRLIAFSLQKLAQICAIQGKHQEALALFERAMVIYPHSLNDVAASYTTLLFTAQSNTDAVAHLQKFLFERLSVRSQELYVVITALIQNSESTVASRLLENFSANRHDPYYRAAKAIIAIEDDNYAVGAAQLIRAINMTKGSDPTNAANWALKLANIVYLMGDLTGAVEHMELAVSLEPRNHKYWFRLAELYFFNNELERARAAIDQAIKLSPDRKEYHRLLHEIN